MKILAIPTFALLIVSLSAASLAQASPRWVEMEFRAGGKIILDHQPTSVRTDLVEKLQRLAMQSPRPRLRLIPSKSANYDDVAKALALVQKAGLEINMSGIDKER
jgi:biopolymer transport protein ExbD